MITNRCKLTRSGNWHVAPYHMQLEPYPREIYVQTVRAINKRAAWDGNICGALTARLESAQNKWRQFKADEIPEDEFREQMRIIRSGTGY